MTLEEKILKILLDNTDTEGRYVGGGHEPEIIVFKNSEDCDKDIFLSQIRDEIISELKPVMEEMKEALEDASERMITVKELMRKNDLGTWQMLEPTRQEKVLSKYNELFKK